MQRSRGNLWTVAATVAVLCLVALAGCSRTPQLHGDEECLGAADALWTAIGAKRNDLVDRCAGDFERLHAASKMSDEAYQALTEIVATTRSGEWADARVALKSFVQGQRRDTP